MGAWGHGLFENDLALDVRGDFEEALDEGLSPADAARAVLDRYDDVLPDPDDGPVVWLVLAALQLEQGALDPEMQARAIGIVDGGLGLRRWVEAGPEALAERGRVLAELRQRLRSAEAGDERGGRRGRRERAKPEIGDVVAIPLPDGRTAYGQYVYWHEDPVGPWGEMVRVFDLVTEEEVPVERLATAEPMFPPVVVMLEEALASGRWRVIGRLPAEEFRYPPHRFLHEAEPEPGVYHDWWLWDGQKETYIGDLPAEYRALEYWNGYDAEELERRIATGEYFGDRLL